MNKVSSKMMEAVIEFVKSEVAELSDELTIFTLEVEDEEFTISFPDTSSINVNDITLIVKDLDESELVQDR